MIVTAEHLERIIDFEATLDIDDHKFAEGGVPMWSYIRWPLARALYAASGGLAPSPAPRARSAIALARRFVLAARHPPWPRGQRAIAFVSTTSSTIQRGSHYFNRLVDPFAEQFFNASIVIEESVDTRRRTPRSFPTVASIDAFALRAAVEARFTAQPSADRQRAATLIAKVVAAFPELSAMTIAGFSDELTAIGRRLPSFRRSWEAVFDATAPRLLVVEGACYGAAAHLMLWARERGIQTAEHQHGLISPNHEAYNFGSFDRGGAFARTLPQTLLSYGDAWCEGVRLPIAIRCIGNPDLSDAVERVRARPSPPPREILFISAAMDPDRYVEVVQRIAAALSTHEKVIFRPHPTERNHIADRYAALLQCSSVILDRTPSLHESIARARAVVGDFSTALFEAMALGRPVAVLDGAQARQHIDETAMPFLTNADDAADFALATRAPPTPLGTSDGRYWATDWRRRYRAFVSETITALQ